jgi:hypothetical protein
MGRSLFVNPIPSGTAGQCPARQDKIHPGKRGFSDGSASLSVIFGKKGFVFFVLISWHMTCFLCENCFCRELSFIIRLVINKE